MVREWLFRNGFGRLEPSVRRREPHHRGHRKGTGAGPRWLHPCPTRFLCAPCDLSMSHRDHLRMRCRSSRQSAGGLRNRSRRSRWFPPGRRRTVPRPISPRGRAGIFPRCSRSHSAASGSAPPNSSRWACYPILRPISEYRSPPPVTPYRPTRWEWSSARR